MTRLTLDINFVDLSIGGKPKYEPHIEEFLGETRGAFATASGQHYSVGVSGTPVAEAYFHNARAHGYKQMLGVSGAGGSDTPHIFHAVNHVIREHVRQNPAVHTVSFMANTHEPSRVKLYRSFAKRVDPAYQERADPFDTHFYVNANAFRDPR